MGNITENRLDLILSDDDRAAIQDALAVVMATLPQISLTDEQRRKTKRINVHNKIFVEDAIYQLSAPGAPSLPPFVSVADMQNDYKLYEQVDQIRASLMAVRQRLDDILLVSGHELYTAALASYRAFSTASRVGIPGAKTAHEALRVRFSGQGRTVGS